MGIKERTKKKKEYSVKEIADEQEYGKDEEKKGSELTSGAVKLMTIFSRGRGSKTLGIGEENLRWSSWKPRMVPPP